MPLKNKLPKEIRASNFHIQHCELEYEVISCKQAALAKNICIANELKTLVMKTSHGLMALHVPGNMQANLREIKTFLNCKQACLVSPEELGYMGLAPGKVCPIIEPIWSLPHLISRQVLDLEFISTNDGTRTGYIIFPPETILLSEQNDQGNFSK